MLFVQFLRVAIRRIIRRPVFSVFVIVTLALGLGVNIVFFQIIDAVLFASVPAKDPKTLVRIFTRDEKTLKPIGSSLPVYQDYKADASGFADLAAYADWTSANASANGQPPEKIACSIVTGNYFDLLGLRAAKGRLLAPGDDLENSPPVVVVSRHFWETTLHSTPDVIGSSVVLNNLPFTVVGVAPERFTGLDLHSKAEIWVPISFGSTVEPILVREKLNRTTTWLQIIGRRKPEVSLAQIESQLSAIFLRSLPERPTGNLSPIVIPANNVTDRDQVRLSWMMLCVIVMVLLLAITDVASLLLARAESEKKDLAIRLALGEPKSYIILPIMCEGLLLSMVGELIAVVVALFLKRALGYFQFSLPIPVEYGSPLLHWRVLVYMLAIGLGCSIFVNIAPILRAFRLDLNSSLKATDFSIRAGHWQIPFKAAFTVAQVAMSMVLLILSGLLIRTLRNDLAIDPGFTGANVTVVSLNPAKDGIVKGTAVDIMYRMLESATRNPHVAHVALGNSVPLQSGMRTSVSIREYGTVDLDFNLISEDYFATLGISFQYGRDFNELDRKGTVPVAIINETMARRFWPGQTAVGRLVQDVGPEGDSVEVVGVVKDFKNRGLREDPAAVLYVPVRQFYDSFPFQSRMKLLIKTPLNFGAMGNLDTNAGFDKRLNLLDPISLQKEMEASFVQERLLAFLLGLFGLLALFLAASGLYALLMFLTHSRTREFGIRMALGAPPGNISRLVLSQALRLLIAGLLLGSSTALVLGQFMKHLFFHVSPADPWTFLAVSAGLSLIAFIACSIPARKAGGIDPASALRIE